MKKSILILFAILFTAGLSFSQDDMKPPAPVDNSFLKMSEGNWVSEPYEFMGMKWTDESNLKWVLNNQFLEIRTKSSSDKGMVMNMYGLMSADKDGNFKAWFFDDFGLMSASTFEGKTEGNKLTMTGGGPMSKGSGMITIDGGKMIQDFTFTMKGKDGKDETISMKVTSMKK